MASIPVDIIIDIFYRLPVKSLLRFKSLSKHFCSMIDDPGFIRRHHSASPETKSNRSLIFRGTNKPVNPHLYSLDLDSAVDHYSVKILDLPLDWPFRDVDRLYVIGCCDGLLALSHATTTLCFLNVSTKLYRVLPKFQSDSSYYYAGFGRDVATDDYKLVTIIINNIDKCFLEVIVYSLRANTWRRIDDHPNYFKPYNRIGTLVGGALNWLVEEEEDGNLIISFALKSEKFYEVSIPDIIYGADRKWVKLDLNVLEGCLCLSSMNGCKHVSDIWLMKKYGVNESWTKLFSFSFIDRKPYKSPVLKALIYSKHGDEVFRFQHKGDVF